MIPTPEERLGVLEAGHKALVDDILEIKGDVREMRADLAQRPTEAMAKSMARVWAFAAASFTGLVSSVVIIAMNT